jgi:hypothetical protein
MKLKTACSRWVLFSGNDKEDVIPLPGYFDPRPEVG